MKKGRKLRRAHNVFKRNQRRRRILTIIGTVCMAVVICLAGYFFADYLSKNPISSPNDKTTSSISPSSTEPSTTAPTTKPTTGVADPLVDTLRAVYVPMAKLRDTSALTTLLGDAKQAGFNAILFDLKDEDGLLHYAFETELAKKSKAITAEALTKEELTAMVSLCKSNGFVAIPRLYAFKDRKAPYGLPSAKITVKGYPNYTWLDRSKEKGGKPWLNPYSPDAHAYVQGLAKELAQAGFPVVMMDGVQFPEQTAQADYGNTEYSSLSQSEVLSTFLEGVRSAVGDNCLVLHTMPGLSAIGGGTAPFGGNPVTFGSHVVCPTLLPSTLGNKLKIGETTLQSPASFPVEAVNLTAAQVKLRCELMSEDKRPRMMPWLEATNYSAEQIQGQMSAVKTVLGDKVSYIVYSADGSYPFSMLR